MLYRYLLSLISHGCVCGGRLVSSGFHIHLQSYTAATHTYKLQCVNSNKGNQRNHSVTALFPLNNNISYPVCGKKLKYSKLEHKFHLYVERYSYGKPSFVSRLK